ncbi:uncharacterized protein LOC110913873 [Helianthus annuus]|uniref:uncharacterized protein LOC110913873 n=1 Tax=Helianthus annuus TaxID=4232 RepID=UPI000B8FDADE|nr:uncharacterized protein LOC110913873 [Helianthus annuus]
MSKLDRYLVNDLFLSYWPKAKVEVLKRGNSDHCPIVLSCVSSDFGPTPFKFFNYWIGDSKLDDIVNGTVNLRGSGIRKDLMLAYCLKGVKAEIKKWRVAVNLAEKRELKEIIDKIKSIENNATKGLISDADKSLRVDLRVKANKIEMAKIKDLQQKARVKWLKHGDENNSFFHKAVSINLARNRINGLIFNGILFRIRAS